ncbi:uncharacterized protein [Physcomitrium patens]|uniref:uncharacterized protein isoform X2 n=1 Tax=Physcomitrium patens TaxID=3218 RepID=UPI003CCC9FB3
MGNPSSGSKVQTTMSLPKGRHRQSLSVGGASLQLEKYDRLSSSERISSTVLSPRTTEEKAIAAFLGDKKTKRRTRSSLGGSEEFIKGFSELNGVALAAEERKPLGTIPFRGHRRAGSGNVTPKAAESPRAKGMCPPPGVEKNAVTKMSASLFHSPTKLERSMSLSRVAHRVIPDADRTPRCRAGVGEVILPGKRDALRELKRQDLPRGHRSENGSGRKSFSVHLEKIISCGNGENCDGRSFSHTGSGGLKSKKGVTPSDHVNDENSHFENQPQGTKMPTLETWSSHEQWNWNAAYMPVKDIHPVCFETITKKRSEQPMTTRSLDLGRDLYGSARRSSFSNAASMQLSCVSKGSNPDGSESFNESLSGNLSSTHIENSYRIKHSDALLISQSLGSGYLSWQPSPNITPSKRQSFLDQTHQNLKNLHCHPLPLPPPSQASQTTGTVAIQQEKQKKAASTLSDKVTEEDLTEAAILSSLVGEDDPAGPVLISEESKRIVPSASLGRQVGEVLFSSEREIGLRNPSGPDACLRKSISFEPTTEEKSRIGHENRNKLRKRRRSVSASGIGAMLLKVVRVSDTGPSETMTVPIADAKVSGVDQNRDYPDQTIMPRGSQSQFPTTRLHQDCLAEPEANSTEVVDMDVEYQNCSTELVAPDVASCGDVTTEDLSFSEDIERPSEEMQGGETEMVLNLTQGDQLAGSGSDSVGPNPHDKQGNQKILLETIGNPDPLNADGNCPEISADAGIEDLEDNAHQREESFRSVPNSKVVCQEEKINNREALLENARLNAPRFLKREEGVGGSRRKRLGSKGRVSYDLDKSAEWKAKKAEVSEADTETEHTQAIDTGSKQPPALLDENVTITKERPRSFGSMLQVSPLDEMRLAPSSISILANPSFSSSHQDRLWEEQAEAYSSGGRGTPGREDDTAAYVPLQSPTRGGTISSDDQSHSAAGSLRKPHGDLSVMSTTGVVSDSGHSIDKRKGLGKKRSRPRTPLRSLMAEDHHSKSSSIKSPDSHSHFLQHIMSRIRGGSSSKSLSSKSQDTIPKRRTTIWSSCMCFSHIR